MDRYIKDIPKFSSIEEEREYIFKKGVECGIQQSNADTITRVLKAELNRSNSKAEELLLENMMLKTQLLKLKRRTN